MSNEKKPEQVEPPTQPQAVPSSEPAKIEPTPERAREEKKRMEERAAKLH